MDPPMDLPISIPVHDVDPQLLIPALKSHLPYSLPLLRRCQHSLVHPSPTAKYLATATVLDAVGDLKPASDSESVSVALRSRGSRPDLNVGVTGGSVGVPTPWLAAWVDLHAGPETQVVVYSSLEADGGAPAGTGDKEDAAIEDTDVPRISTLHAASHHVKVGPSTPSPDNGSTVSPNLNSDPLDRVRAQLLALLSHIQNRLMPDYLQSFSLHLAPESAREANTSRTSTSTTTSRMANNNDSRRPNPPGQPFGPRAFKIGHLHTGLFSVLTASGNYPSSPLNQTQTHGSGPSASANASASPLMVVPGLRVHRYDYPPYNKYLFRDEEFVIADGDRDGDHDDDGDRERVGDHQALIQHSGSRSRSTTSGSASSAVIPPVNAPVSVNHESRSESKSNPSLLPPGYRFSDRQGNSTLRAHHYELICRRSTVFRTPKSLASFVGVAVYVDAPSPASPSRPPSETSNTSNTSTSSNDTEEDEEEDDEEPIAWAFLSADGTLAVLHVEQDHRGKGLAEAASREVMRRGMRAGGKFRAEGEQGWAHADVAPGNRASCRVMEKLGGRVGWTVTWTVLEVDGLMG